MAIKWLEAEVTHVVSDSTGAYLTMRLTDGMFDRKTKAGWFERGSAVKVSVPDRKNTDVIASQRLWVVAALLREFDDGQIDGTQCYRFIEDHLQRYSGDPL